MIKEELCFIWVGSTAHYVDSICPKLGHMLGRKYHIRSMFCNGTNIAEVKQQCLNLRKDKTRRFKFISIDVGFLQEKYNKAFMIRVDGGIKPAEGVKEQKIHIGDMGFVLNINHMYNHLNQDRLDSFKLNIIDAKVRRKRNKLLRHAYAKLDEFLSLALNSEDEQDGLRQTTNRTNEEDGKTS